MYAIAGVTGHTGGAVAENLLARKDAVRVIVRDAEKGARWKERGAEVAMASLDDAESLTAALRGADGAYLLLPPDPASTDMVADNAARVQVIGRAIAAANVPHVVFLSAAGAQHPSGTGPIKTLHHAEVELPKLAPNTRFTFLRPGYYVESVTESFVPAENMLLALFDPEKRIPMVATADVGRVAAAALVEGPRRGRESIVEIAGPREVSFSEIASDLSAVLGKPIAPVRVPAPEVKSTLEGAGFPSDIAGLYAEMAQALESGLADYERNGARFERGRVEPREVLRELVG